jgi:PadR family transcriptional regulator
VGRTDLLPGTLEMLILRALEDGELHGYAVARRIQERSADVLRVEEGSLYPALHRLEERGWIRAEQGRSENNRRARFYRLTAAGRRRLRAVSGDYARMAAAIARVMSPA